MHVGYEQQNFLWALGSGWGLSEIGIHAPELDDCARWVTGVLVACNAAWT